MYYCLQLSANISQDKLSQYTGFLDLGKTLYLCDWLNIILISVQQIIMN
jgi:hypothetical protein